LNGLFFHIMKRLLFILCTLALVVSAQAQKTGKVFGTIKDAGTSETLIQATILFNERGVLSDFDGNYSIELPYGTYTVKASYVGYTPIEKTIEVNSPSQQLNIELSGVLLQAAEVVTDLIVDRETPIAVSDIKPIQIQEELGSQPIPMILNSTPGVYATMEGSDDNGPSISIRGFKQRNVSVMIDGIPVNDMETGGVFWNNWFGLDLVTQTMQVQRGLGASKLALPAIGGTVNVVTQGIDAKKQTSVKQEVGSNGFLRTTLGHTTGRLKGGWGFTFAGSYKRANGFITNTGSEAFFYYAKIQKELGNHVLSFSAMGAPSLNNTRAYQQRIVTHDKDYARSLFDGSDAEYARLMNYSQEHRAISNGPNAPVVVDGELVGFTQDILIDSLNNVFGFSSEEEFMNQMNQTSFIDTSDVIDRGLRYNIHWGELNGEQLNERQNRYHKPLFSLRHSWRVSDKFFVSNMAYASYGRGGGTALAPGLGLGDYDENGQVDFQRFYNANTTSVSSIDPLYSETERKSGWILRKGFNNHQWLGLLSTFKWEQSEKLSVSGGVDFRTYKAQHYAEVFDLLGGDYYIPNNFPEGEDPMKRVGDRIDFDNEVFVNWGGVFGLAEYKATLWNAFLNVSAVYQGYNRIDNFIEPEDTERTGAEKESGWKWIPGYTIKTGGAYKLSEWSNVFMNAGFLNRTPVSRNVIGFDNKFVQNVENEEVSSLELGYKFSRYPFSLNVNGYYTIWNNRPLDELLSIELPSGERVRANVNAMSALHKGMEVDAAYKFSNVWSIEGYVSLGDWKWTSSEDSLILIDQETNLPYINPNTGDPETISYNASGVYVGDAPQFQYSLAVKYAKKGFYIKPRFTFFDKFYADFDPFSLFDENEGRQSWRIPAYGLLDIHAGYGFDVNKSKVDLRLSVFNALNTVYIINAQNNDTNALPFYRNENDRYSFRQNNFDASSASVYMGQGARMNFSVRVRF
jgi:iron complex outermembrane receptor protein